MKLKINEIINRFKRKKKIKKKILMKLKINKITNIFKRKKC